MQRSNSYPGTSGGGEPDAAGSVSLAPELFIQLSLQSLYFLLEHRGDAMPGQIDSRRAHTKLAGDLLHRPFLEDAEVEDLIMLGIDLALDKSSTSASSRNGRWR